MKYLTQSPNLNHLWCRLIIEELIRNGIDHFCVAPGSRSSPLACAVGEHPRARSVVHYDERGLGFFALGESSALRKPAVLICTSGTAAANFYPAVVEASKKKVPLIVLTADRPPELRFTGANQTIDQVELYGKYVRFQFDCPCPTKDIPPETILTTIDQILYQSTAAIAGPVHLNCMFREPLAPLTEGGPWTKYLSSVRLWQKGREPWTRYRRPDKRIFAADLKDCAKRVNRVKRGIIVVGKLHSAAEEKSVIALAEKLQWPVFPDISSGLRLGDKSPLLIPYFDQILRHPRARKLPVDGILHLGGRITSRIFYEFTGEKDLNDYITVLNHPLRNDPLHKVSLRIEGRVEDFCRNILPRLKAGTAKTFLRTLQKASLRVSSSLIQHDQDTTLSEPHIARVISQNIPRDHILFLSNSLPIREFDRYADVRGPAVEIAANRGASGIDGIIASACGCAAARRKPLTLLAGDLALLHDLNSLSLVRQTGAPILIVVLNNDGGGIFSFLPIARDQRNFEKFFGTPHGLCFKDAAALFDLQYACPADGAEFLEIYRRAARKNQSMIIETNTGRQQNIKLQKQMEKETNEHLQKCFK